ncbi:MAG: hypothetical protein U0929_14305 [Planctomycetaceae bacterium]
MGVLIKAIYRMEGYHDRHFGTICHNEHMLKAVLIGAYDQLTGLVGKVVTAEYSLNEIKSVEMNLPQADWRSGMYPAAIENHVIVDGTVCNEFVIDEAVSLFDIYIQNGADFLCMSSEELQAKPKLNTRIQITGVGLHVYPSYT